MKWKGFWDQFEAAVHKNTKLADVDKFNYLKAELEGDALAVISGLQLSSENYTVAVELLQKRFGKKERIIDAHYTELTSLTTSSSNVSKLRLVLDNLERHLRCLETLGENIEQGQLIYLIKSKLPDEFLIQLEHKKEEDTPWTVASLCKAFNSELTMRESMKPVHHHSTMQRTHGIQKGASSVSNKTQQPSRSSTEVLSVSQGGYYKQKGKPGDLKNVRLRGGPPPVRDFFVYRVMKPADEDDVAECLRENNIKFESVLRVSKEEAKFCSFKLTVPLTDIKRVMEPDVWPEGVRIRKFTTRPNHGEPE